MPIFSTVPKLMRVKEKPASERARDLRTVLQLIEQLKACSCTKNHFMDRYSCHYATLGVAHTATLNQIQEAYKAMVPKLQTQAAALKFPKIKEAYTALLEKHGINVSFSPDGTAILKSTASTSGSARTAAPPSNCDPGGTLRGAKRKHTHTDPCGVAITATRRTAR